MEPARIVLIEDNPADVLLVRMALKENGISHELCQYECGADAVAILCAPGGSAPDAILLDLNTPRTDGFEALKRLTQSPHLAGVPIAILSSSGASSDKRLAASLGTRYVVKPTRLNDFIASVGRVVKEMLDSKAAIAETLRATASNRAR